MTDKTKWPAWFYGPGGKGEIFQAQGDVPDGWQDHPDKVSDTAKSITKAPKAPATDAEATELDAAGTKWDPALHAATKTKTSAGLWRMKVGVSRPPLDL